MHPERPAVAEGPLFVGGDVVEVPLLLTARQAAALEALAHARGLTASRLLRALVLEFLTGRRPLPPARRGGAADGP